LSLPLPLPLPLQLQLQLQLPLPLQLQLQLPLPLQVPAVILSAAKDPEELRSPQPPEHFHPYLQAPVSHSSPHNAQTAPRQPKVSPKHLRGELASLPI
jgi:hypothetical protein